MTTTYRQLLPEEPVMLASLLQQAYILRSIDKVLERSPSFLSREVAPNGGAARYASQPARPVTLARRVRSRLPLILYANGAKWQVVSHGTIYNAIDARLKGELHKALVACLRHAFNTPRPRSGGEHRHGQIPEMVSIHVRPNGRFMRGHWEGDPIKDEGNPTGVDVLVERAKRLVLLTKMPDIMAESALVAFAAELTASHHRWANRRRTSKARRWRGTVNWLATPPSRVTSATRIVLGSAAALRTPTDCCPRGCPRARTCRFTINVLSIRWPICSITARAKPSNGEFRFRSSRN
jgi:IS30 family transposase